MKTENVVLMKMARESLRGKWGLAIGSFLVYFLIIAVIQVLTRFFPLSGLLSLIIMGPLVLGVAIFSLSLSRNQDAKLEQIFQGFNSTNFGIAIGAYLLMVFFIILWMLLFIVPGIIAAISYSMTFYILADYELIGAMEAIDKSKKIMYGYKWKFFCLGLRFLGWAFLCILTLGIGFLWLMPYMQVSMAKFYEDVKANPNEDRTNLEPEVTTKLNETANKKEGVYYEKDNIGTRILSADRNQAAYNTWVLNGSPEIGVINYHFKTKEEAYSAMMEIPCIKLAADSKNLISLEIVEFGVFQDTDNDNDWEAFLQGQSLSLSSFKAAETSFIKHNGKKIFCKEPKNTEQNKAKPINKTKDDVSGGVKFIRNTNVEMMGVTGTKEIYEAPDKKSAIEFLKTKTIRKQYYFIEIETSDGWVGKDKDGVYET